MSQKWLNQHNGKPLPKGLRIRTGANSALRIYVRMVDFTGRQKDIPTPYDANDRGAIDDAAAFMHELKAQRARARADQLEQSKLAAGHHTTQAGLQPGPKTRGTVADALAIEFLHWTRGGKVRTSQAIRAWETAARQIMNILGQDTLVSSLTSNDLYNFVLARIDTTVKEGLRASTETALRNVQLFRGATRRAQEAGHVPGAWAIRWPTRGDFDRRQPNAALTANVIPWAELVPFFAELRRQCTDGPNKTAWGQSIPEMFKFSLVTGMRAGELEKLRVKDVEPSRIMIHGKRDLPRWFEYGSEPYRIAQRVIQLRGLTHPDHFLFAPSILEASTVKALSYAHGQVARRASKRLGLTRAIKLRDMRATAGRRVYDGGRYIDQPGNSVKDLKGAQAFLRHKTIDMTQTYLNVKNAIDLQHDNHAVHSL